MPRSKNPQNLPLNKQGGLNLNWAISQALAKLGDDAKIADVRKFIVREYNSLGKAAVENPGSLSTGISATRRKMRDEASKVPPVPVSTNGVQPAAPSVSPRPDQTPPGTVTSAAFGQYVKTTLRPALQIVRDALGAAFKEPSKDDLNKLKQAIAEVESAQKVFGDEVPTICAMVAVNG